MKQILFIIIFLILLNSTSPFIGQPIKKQQIEHHIIYVDDDNTIGPWVGSKEYPFQSIQKGINAAKTDDTVFVRNGTYPEQKINCNTSLTLIGEHQENTIIKGNDSFESYFLISCSSIHISNLTFHDYMILDSPFHNDTETDDEIIIIDNNTIISNVAFLSADQNETNGMIIIENNTIVNRDNENFFSIFIMSPYFKTRITSNTISGYEIGVAASTDLIIQWNTISHCWYGVTAIINTGSQIIVSKNNFIENEVHGLFGYHIDFSSKKDSNFPAELNQNQIFSQYKTNYSPITLRNIFRFMQWDNNYWDDKTGFGPKLINGIISINHPSLFQKEDKNLLIPWFHFDWHPAKEPFDNVY